MSNVIKAGKVGRSAYSPPWGRAPELSVPHEPVRRIARMWLDAAPVYYVTRERCRRLLQEAEAEAEAAVKAAASQAESIRQRAQAEGREAGLAAGREEGIRQAQLEAEGALETLRSVLAEAGRLRDEAAERHEAEVVELALAVSRQLVRRLDEVTPETVRQILEEWLPKAAGAREVTVRLNPADLAALERILPDLTARVDGGARVRWEADEGLSCGGCVIETDRGLVDARMETRLARLAEAVAAVVGHGR
ncbi:MAG: hypothetical protein H0Z37_07045 [Firmicutes bacterium]|nr:hypothetical protein [Bacillota bacterium]